MTDYPEGFNRLLSGVRGERLKLWLYRVSLALLALLFVVLSAGLVGFDALVTGNEVVALTVGQVAPEDIRAPVSISYESVVLTNQARQTARDSVRDVYDPPNPAIARQQIQLARQILDYIADVRADEFASPEVQAADIQAIGALALTPEEVMAVVQTSPDRWFEIDQQVISVLERAMRSEIRDDTLRVTKQNLPNLVSVRVREEEVLLITALVEDLIQTNTFFNEERTRLAKEAAAQASPPELRSFVQGQLVVRGGSIVQEADMEALTQLGLLQAEDRRLQELGSALLLVVLVTAIFALYLNRFHSKLSNDVPFVVLIGMIYMVILIGARVSGPGRVVQPFLYPTAALSLLLATIANPQIALVATSGMALMFGAMTGQSLELTEMTLIGGIVGILSLRNTERLNSYFVSGLAIGLANVGVVLAFYMTGYPADSVGALTLIGVGLANGILSGVTALAGLYLISSVFNVPTSLRLIELMQPSQPLLQRLLREAPGTYQHSLQVANLAELAAERVGANVLLTRVGSLYHDVGKMNAPHFFVENQADGVNPHDGLNDPYKSAQIILDHVIDGEKLGRKYRLPSRVRDFILEHHGTTVPMYFYNKAVSLAGGDAAAVDKRKFTYPGPRPRTRETAILMLADSSESTVRARRPGNKQEIADVVKYVFEMRMREGQLDDSGLTMRDLNVMQRVFVETLQGVFHPRIAYSAPTETKQPQLPAQGNSGQPAITEPSAEAVEVPAAGSDGAEQAEAGAQ